MSSPSGAPEGAVGDDTATTDAKGKPSSTAAPSASTFEERILKLDQEIDALDEVERDLAALHAGTWCDERDEDEDEDNLGIWDRTDADEDDEANSLIAAAPTRR